VFDHSRSLYKIEFQLYHPGSFQGSLLSRILIPDTEAVQSKKHLGAKIHISRDPMPRPSHVIVTDGKRDGVYILCYIINVVVKCQESFPYPYSQIRIQAKEEQHSPKKSFHKYQHGLSARIHIYIYNVK
jgi:hypothetical protein